MKVLEFSDLSSEKMQNLIDRLYASFGLPFEGETCRGQLAEVLPMLVAESPALGLDGAGAERYLPDGRMWDPKNYDLHVPFEPINYGTCPKDKRMNLWLRGAYRRKSGVSSGPEFVDVTCYCLVAISDGELLLDVQCRVDLLERHIQKDADKPLPFSYVLDSRCFINAMHGLRLKGQPSPQAIDGRRLRIAQQNEQSVKRRTELLDALQELPSCTLFPYTDGIALVGEKSMSSFTHELGRVGDWIKVMRIPDDDRIEYNVSIYSPDDHGGLRETHSCEIGFSINSQQTDEELVKYFQRTRR